MTSVTSDAYRWPLIGTLVGCVLLVAVCGSSTSAGVTAIGQYIDIPAYAPSSMVVPSDLIGPSLATDCKPGARNQLPSDQVASICGYYKFATSGFVALFASRKVGDGTYPSIADLCSVLAGGLASHGWSVKSQCPSRETFQSGPWKGIALFQQNFARAPSPTGGVEKKGEPQVTIALGQPVSTA